MNNKDIQKARKEYARRQKEKEKLIALKEELEKLESNPHVKRYLEINGVKNSNIPSEKDIIRYSFSGITKDENDFKVYLYMGAYDYAYNYDERDSQVFDRSKADYLLYLNIGDEFDSVQIKPSMQEEFERQNIVLKPKSTVSAEKKYHELQIIYYEELLKSDLRKKGKILEKVKAHL